MKTVDIGTKISYNGFICFYAITFSIVITDGRKIKRHFSGKTTIYSIDIECQRIIEKFDRYLLCDSLTYEEIKRDELLSMIWGEV